MHKICLRWDNSILNSSNNSLRLRARHRRDGPVPAVMQAIPENSAVNAVRHSHLQVGHALAVMQETPESFAVNAVHLSHLLIGRAPAVPSIPESSVVRAEQRNRRKF